MRVRRNVYRLPAGDRTLYWYGLGVAAMQSRPASDPLSWQYQGAVHGSSAVPTPAQRPYWSQCQHATSFFLPWHRMYLLRFERIIAAEILAQGGPADWALPYWNYSDPGQQLLPPEFRSPANAAGIRNPLYVARRFADANAGRPFLSPRDVDLNTCLRASGTTLPGSFFGGPAAAHFGGAPGSLELAPHNAIHVAVGRGGGLMADPDLAALDPIFWLHHANIDRLWEVWLRRDPSHQNLASPYWLNGVTFHFHTETGAVSRMKTADVLNLAAPAVDYSYDDVSDPLGVPGVAGLPIPAPIPMGTNPQMELVGATMAPIQLDSQVRHVALPTPVTQAEFLAAVAPPGVAPDAVPAAVQRVTLLLENVTSSNVSPTYDVYINLPDANEPGDREDLFVGRAALFGIAQASEPQGRHGGSGQTVGFDVTELYRQLEKKGQLDRNSLKVSFVPIHPEGNEHVSVGRIGLYFA